MLAGQARAQSAAKLRYPAEAALLKGVPANPAAPQGSPLLHLAPLLRVAPRHVGSAVPAYCQHIRQPLAPPRLVQQGLVVCCLTGVQVDPSGEGEGRVGRVYDTQQERNCCQGARRRTAAVVQSCSEWHLDLADCGVGKER